MAWLDEKATHHCAVFQGDEHGASERGYRNCKINPGHNKFIRAADFREEHLPKRFRRTEVVRTLRRDIDRTVRVVIKYTSRDRPDKYPHTDIPYPCIGIRGSENHTRLGTGYVCRCIDKKSILMGLFCTSTGLDNTEECPCTECNPDFPNQRENTGPKRFKGSKKESYHFIVSTATHVIYDKYEARKAVFELFYDSDDRKGIKLLYGVGVFDQKVRRLETDKCYAICVTHDATLARKLERLVHGFTRSLHFSALHSLDTGILISHPHGVSKRISIGKVNTKFLVGRQGSSPVELFKHLKLRFTAQQNEAGEYRDLDQPSYHELLNESPTFDAASGKSEAVYLQSDVTVVPPPDQHIERCFSKDGRLWYRLPFGTELITENSRSYIVPMMEFRVDDKYTNLYAESWGYITYDMGSCPGSSGARVIHDERLSLMSEGIHYGAREGENMSGLGHLDQPRNLPTGETMYDLT